MGDTKWFDLFQDETLRGLIQEALRANYDIRIAAQRVLQAEGQLTATRSGSFPQLGAQADAARTGVKSPIQSTGWRIRMALHGRSICLASCAAPRRRRAPISWPLQENQKAVMQALVAQVASAYFDLREYDAELEYVRESIKTRQESVKLVARGCKAASPARSSWTRPRPWSPPLKPMRRCWRKPRSRLRI